MSLSLLSHIKTFRQCENGAVTTDWVFLSALVIGLGMMAVDQFKNGTITAADNAAGCATIVGDEMIGDASSTGGYAKRMARAQQRCGNL